MMKIFKSMMIALMALLAFTSCDNFSYSDSHSSADLAGIWTIHTANYAEALVIKADGSVVSTGVENGKYWENVKGNIVVEDGVVSMTLEDDDNIEGHFDIVPGVAFTIYTEEGKRYTYNYCANDLADEVIGMWVCTQTTLDSDAIMAVNVYQNDGKAIFTGLIHETNEYMANIETKYKVIGDLMIQESLAENSFSPYMVFSLSYAPNGTSLGDILTNTYLMEFDGTVFESSSTLLRVKQSLDLADKKYDHIKTFVTNVKGADKDIDILGTTFNFAKMDGVKLNKMLKTLLFAVEFPNANTIRYNYFYNGKNNSLEAPIVVDGNKMTVKMSVNNPLLKDIDLYTFQDVDATQLHMYLPTYAFINFFGNMQVTMMAQNDLLDLDDTTAVNAIYDSIDNAVEAINVSFVMEKSN